jgi:hypothetical protein
MYEALELHGGHTPAFCLKATAADAWLRPVTFLRIDQKGIS